MIPLTLLLIAATTLGMILVSAVPMLYGRSLRSGALSLEEATSRYKWFCNGLIFCALSLIISAVPFLRATGDLSAMIGFTGLVWAIAAMFYTLELRRTARTRLQAACATPN